MNVSVCLATYNGAAFLKEQLDSICVQMLSNDELIISDDASTDQTVQIVNDQRAAFPGLDIRLVSNQRAGGVVANFERALKFADREAIVLCDQDDVWLPGRLSQVRNALISADLVLMNGNVVDGALNPRGQTIFDSVGMKSGFFSNLVKNSFIGCCMAFRRRIRDQVIPFPRNVPWHDWYIGLFAELTGRVVRLDEITLLYRRHGANFSPTGEKSANSFGKKISMRLAVLHAVFVAWQRGGNGVK